MTSSELDGEPTIVKIGSPADMVGIIPYLIGFQPTESLVASCLHGERQRTGTTMRVDLPPPADTIGYAEELAGRVAHENADEALVVCYTGACDVDDELPRCELIDAVTDALGAEGIRVVDALLVRDGRWWSYTCTRGCCPREGTPLPDATAGAVGRFAAEAALRGQALLPSREQMELTVAGPEVGPRAELDQHFLAGWCELALEAYRVGTDEARTYTVDAVKEGVARWSDGVGITDAEVARIGVGLFDLLARDDVATMPVGDAESYVALLVELAHRTPDTWAAPICTVLAWVAYQHGGGALANVAVDRALRCDPTYRMALMIRDALFHQVHPRDIREIAASTQRQLHPE